MMNLDADFTYFNHFSDLFASLNYTNTGIDVLHNATNIKKNIYKKSMQGF